MFVLFLKCTLFLICSTNYLFLQQSLDYDVCYNKPFSQMLASRDKKVQPCNKANKAKNVCNVLRKQQKVWLHVVLVFQAGNDTPVIHCNERQKSLVHLLL